MTHALEDIEKLINLMRRNGVRYVKMGDVEIAVGGSAPATGALDGSSLKPMCPGGCGHYLWDHRTTGCIHGCDPSKCVPKPPDVKP